MNHPREGENNADLGTGNIIPNNARSVHRKINVKGCNCEKQ